MTTRVLLLTLALLGAGTWPAAAGDPGLKAWATAFDTLHDDFPRVPALTDLKTPYGTLVDISCRGTLTVPEAEKAATAFSRVVESSLTRIKACSEKIPALLYLSDAVAVMRRLVVVCTKTSEDANFQGKEAAGAYARRRGLAKSKNERMRREGGDDPASYTRSYFMVVPDSITAFLDSSSEWQASTLFHESLHYTGAGNLRDHDKVERIAQDPDEPCARNEFDDRIRMLEAVCGFRVKEDPSFNQVSELRYRFRHCGLARACVQVLTHADKPDDASAGYGFWEKLIHADTIDKDQRDADHEYGRNINEREAGLLCAKMNAVLAPGSDAARSDAPDIDAHKRLAMALSYVLREAGGLSEEVPAYYLGALPVPERMVLASIPDLEARIKDSCGSLAAAVRPEEKVSRYLKLPPAQLKDLRKLKPYDDDLDADCPLSSSHPVAKHTAILGAFHDQERVLQKSSLEFLDELTGFVSGERASIDGIEDRIRAAYMMRCAGTFRPRLCFGGEGLLLQAVTETRARLEL